MNIQQIICVVIYLHTSVNLFNQGVDRTPVHKETISNRSNKQIIF